ncbi:hypothetical protein R6Q57_014210 [Mikania cordata]
MPLRSTTTMLPKSMTECFQRRNSNNRMIFGNERNILPLGKVTHCIVVKHSNGHSKGFGFVTFDDDSSMKSSIQRMDGCLLHCRHIKVAPSRFRGEK